MLNYLKIFSWFLFTFGVVGFIVVAAGFTPNIGSAPAALSLLAIQTGFASIIIYGFKQYRDGKLGRTALVYGGWALIIVLLIFGQIWINTNEINF